MTRFHSKVMKQITVTCQCHGDTHLVSVSDAGREILKLRKTQNSTEHMQKAGKAGAKSRWSTKTKKGQIIGTLKDGVFRKVVKKSKHLMRLNDAWGIQYTVIQDLNGTCTEIRIKDSENGVVYSIPFSVFFNSSEVHDFGDGMQAFCPRALFTVVQ